MTDISNKTLVYLLVIAVAITLVGTTISLAKLGKFQIPLFTGMATRTEGTTNITIASLVSISFEQDGATNYSMVDFVNGSLASTGYTSINTTAATNPSTFAEPTEFRIQNDGNVDVNVTVNASTPNTFLGGTDINSYMFNASNTEAGCAFTDAPNMSATPANFTTAPQILCTNLTWRNAADAVGMEIYLIIRSDHAAGLITDSDVGAQAAACVAPFGAGNCG